MVRSYYNHDVVKAWKGSEYSWIPYSTRVVLKFAIKLVQKPDPL